MAAQFARRLALIAFALASLRGVLARADFAGAMQTALAALALFFCLGWVLGELARRLVEELAEAEFARLRAPTGIAEPHSAHRP